MSQIKTRDRVRDLGEVYTAEREVNAMLDLVGPLSRDIDATFLEPACGNGNFLAEILDRKLATVAKKHSQDRDEYEFGVVRALCSIYGIDIDKSNVRETRERLNGIILDHYSLHMNTYTPRTEFLRAADAVLKANIVVGDSLRGAHKITIIEYGIDLDKMRISRTRHTLASLAGGEAQEDLFAQAPESERPVHFLRLAA